MPKLASINNVHRPKDVEFLIDGKKKKNSEFPKDEQLTCNITFASNDQKSIYVQSYAEQGENGKVKVKTDYNYDLCLSRHVDLIKNLTDEKGKGITNGRELVKNKNPELNPIKQDIFFRICGLDDDENENDGPGELSEGEKQASV